MVTEAKPIVIEPGGELDRLLRDAPELPLRLERDGVRYRLERDDDIWAGFDPEAAREGMRATGGGRNGPIDADAFNASIRERRSPRHRPSGRRVNRRIRRGRAAGLAEAPALAPPELAARVPGAGGWVGIADGEAFKRYIRARRRMKNRPSVRW